MAASRVQSFANYSVTPLSNNSRLVTTHAGPGFFILVSYNTPVAVYNRGYDVLAVTSTKNPDIATATTKGHIRDFGYTMRPGGQEEVEQEQLYLLLERITGQRTLP